MSFREDQLQPTEKMVVQVNQHWMILFRPLIRAFLSTIIFGLISFFIRYKLGYSWGLYLLLLVIPSYIRFAWRLWVRANKEYIITTFRIVKQEGIFSKSSFDSPLDKINNVFHNQNFWGRIWNYGNVGLETASEQGTTVFHYIPKPIIFKNTIINQQQAYRSKLMTTNTPVVSIETEHTQDIPALLQKLGELRDQGIITSDEFHSKKKDLLSRL